MKPYKESKWEKFAQNNAEYYIDTNFKEYPPKERVEKFLALGEDFTAETLSRVEKLLPDKRRAVEIGAGVGRLTLPHAGYFDEIIAVDISPTMLEKLRRNAKNVHIENIKTSLPEDGWNEQKVSYVYSYLVFQHIVDINIIEGYIKRLAGCLRKNGVAQLQFDTRSQNIIYMIRNLLPDFILPKDQQKGIQRIRRNCNVLRNLFVKYKLDVQLEINPNTAKHTFILQKSLCD